MSTETDRDPEEAERNESRDVPPGSVDRVLLVFKSLCNYSGGIALDDLVNEVGLPKASLHRALQALRRAGLVEQDPRGPYRLSLEVVRLALAFYEDFDRQMVVTPILHELAEQYTLTTHYGELIGAEVIYIAKVEATRSPVHMSSVVGGRNPAHCTGIGKALLAYTLTDRAAIAQYVSEHGPLQRRTARTLVSVKELVSDFAGVRERRYAIDAEESEEGINCIAFPIYLDSRRRPSGAISLTAVTQHMTIRELIQEAESVRSIIEKRFTTRSS